MVNYYKWLGFKVIQTFPQDDTFVMEADRSNFKLIGKKWRSRLKKTFIRLTYDWRVQSNGYKNYLFVRSILPGDYTVENIQITAKEAKNFDVLPLDEKIKFIRKKLIRIQRSVEKLMGDKNSGSFCQGIMEILQPFTYPINGR
jgi:hypothetical protein